MRFITQSFVALMAMGAATWVWAEPATQPGGSDASQSEVVLTKPIADGRELVVRRQAVSPAHLPEVAQPARPLPVETKLVVPSGLLQITVSLRVRDEREIPLYSRVVQEYAPLQTGYEVIDLQLLDGATLILLSREPTPHLSMTVAHITSGESWTALLSSRSWDSLIAAAVPVDLRQVEARLIGSQIDDIGLSVRDRRGEDPDRLFHFRLNPAARSLEPAAVPEPGPP
jgi:hypothetical protein